MDKELREAAERRRKFKASNVNLLQVGNSSPYYDRYTNTIDFDLHHDDTMSLADAYLAEHPADDGKELTDEWANEVLPKDCDLMERDGEFRLRHKFFHREGGGYGAHNVIWMPTDTTRGEFRALCRGLRIPLKA